MHCFRIILKIFWPVMPQALMACCIGNRKCRQDNFSARFRNLSRNEGRDLVFGPQAFYPKDSILVYSLQGSDAIVHRYFAGCPIVEALYKRKGTHRFLFQKIFTV
jgi:hypothetical protein